MSSTPASLVLFGIAVGAYTLAVVAFVLHLAFRKRWLGDAGMGLVLVGWPLHFASILTRALEAGHWPLGNMYEYSTGIAFVLVTVTVVLMVRARMRLIGLPAMIVTVALMGVAYMLYVPPGQLVPALHSYWLTIHVTSMATSSAVLSFSFFFGMAYLARRWADNRVLAVATSASPASVSTGGVATLTLGGGGTGAGLGAMGGVRRPLASWIQRLFPSAGALDSWSYRFVMIGFPIWTFGVICGRSGASTPGAGTGDGTRRRPSPSSPGSSSRSTCTHGSPTGGRRSAPRSSPRSGLRRSSSRSTRSTSGSPGSTHTLGPDGLHARDEADGTRIAVTRDAATSSSSAFSCACACASSCAAS